MERALVTGGAGFIGSHIVDALLKKSNEVLVIDNLSTGRIENLKEAQAAGGIRLNVLEESITSKKAHKEVMSFRPDTVFHLAAQMNVRLSVKEPAFDAEQNVVGLVNILDAACRCGTKRFIFSSTGGAIYGEQDYFPADEKHPCHAECPYGVSKRAGELYLEYFSRANGISAIALRFGNVYGPRQNPFGEAGVVAIFSCKIIAGEKLRVNGDGEQTRDFIYVDDVVKACLLASEANRKSELRIYNVGTGIESSVNDIVRGLKTAWQEICTDPNKAQVLVEHGPALEGEQRRSVITPSKLETDLGWKYSATLVGGLKHTLESFCP